MCIRVFIKNSQLILVTWEKNYILSTPPPVISKKPHEYGVESYVCPMQVLYPNEGRNILSDNVPRNLWTGLLYQEKGKTKTKKEIFYSINKN
jgi:hypothetical protein